MNIYTEQTLKMDKVRLSTQRYPNMYIVIIITAGDSIRYEDKTGPTPPPLWDPC